MPGRREFLQLIGRGCAVLAASLCGRRAFAQSIPLLRDEEPIARSLQYRSESGSARKCENCANFMPVDTPPPSGRCRKIDARRVLAGAVCKHHAPLVRSK